MTWLSPPVLTGLLYSWLLRPQVFHFCPPNFPLFASLSTWGSLPRTSSPFDDVVILRIHREGNA